MASNALRFNGTTAYVNLSTRPTAVVNNFAITAWITPTLPQTTGLIAYVGNDAGGWGLGCGDINDGSGSKLIGLFGGITWLDPGITLTTGVRVHVAMVRRGGLTLFFVNGVQTGSTNITHTPNTPTASRGTVGNMLSAANAPQRYYKGDLDEVKIFEAGLTDAEILADYNGGVGKYGYSTDTGLVSGFHMDEGTGTSTDDYGTANANGTLTGSTLPTWISGFVTGIPNVTTQAPTNVTRTGATFNGNILDLGTETPTIRGFQYNTVAYPDKESSATGSFSTGAFTDTPDSELIPGTTMYVRAFATNSYGTAYGAWVSFSTIPDTYNVTIDDIDRTADILHRTIKVSDIVNDQNNTCSLSLVDLSSNGIPATDDEIIITLNDGTILFGGYVQTVKTSYLPNGFVRADLSCIDYAYLLDRNLVHHTYEDMTDKEIIEDIVATYCQGSGITTNNVVEGVTIDQISFNYIQPSQALRRISKLTGRNWFIDYEKDIHYFPLATNAAPFNITDNTTTVTGLKISKDASQVKNRVYVRGGTQLSDPTFYEEKGDGVKRTFVLPDKPHNVTVKVNGVTKTLGLKNIDTTGYDWYLNFNEKYVEQDAAGVVLATTDTLRVDYEYDVPILVAVEDTASIIANGQKEFAIFDKTISTTTAARDRASAELTDYANDVVEGEFRTWTPGFISGQYISINSTRHGVNASYLVQSVTAVAEGAGLYYYDIKIASAKTIGVILFLIQLLEANRNLVELDDQEAVDELLSITDSLLSDSLLDSLTIDSAGAYATWCTDSLQATPATRARWDLFQWG